MTGIHRSSKRRAAEAEEEEFCVDDLAVAAVYAAATPPCSASITAAGNNEEQARSAVAEGEYDGLEDDDNEISLGSSATASSSEEVEGVNAAADERRAEVPEEERGDPDQDASDSSHSSSSSSSSSDAESDVDLTEQLARMTKTEDDDENGEEASVPPRTRHEIDAYAADVQRLEEQFEWNVSLQTLVGPVDEGEPRRGLLALAGHVQHHMVDDRTLVILSQGTLLREGTLLVLRRMDEQKKSTIIPLGKILEVFGPVSQPLYSIRLPNINVSASSGHVGEKTEYKHEGKPTPVQTKDEGTDATCPGAQEKSDNAAPSCKAVTLSTSEEEQSTKEIDLSQLGDNPEDQKKEGTVPNGVPKQTPAEADPWSLNGTYTQLLKESPHCPVYFIQSNGPQGTANMLDLNAIYRASGRGCDASNFYDEEAQEIDFSDDEKERLAKGAGRRRSGNSRHRVRQSGRGASDRRHGFPQQQRPPAAFAAAYQAPALEGFHRPTAPSATAHPYPPRPHGQMLSGYGASTNYGAAYPSLSAPPSAPLYGAQPAAPPQGGQAPEEESDTVYYEY